jgi:hypothetical protein
MSVVSTLVAEQVARYRAAIETARQADQARWVTMVHQPSVAAQWATAVAMTGATYAQPVVVSVPSESDEPADDSHAEWLRLNAGAD